MSRQTATTWETLKYLMFLFFTSFSKFSVPWNTPNNDMVSPSYVSSYVILIVQQFWISDHIPSIQMVSLLYVLFYDPLMYISEWISYGRHRTQIFFPLNKVTIKNKHNLKLIKNYKLLPLWVLVCFARDRGSAYPLPQIAQSNGFSPVWLRIWTYKLKCNKWL